MLMGFSAMKMVPISTYGILMNLKAMLVIFISHFYLSEYMTLRNFVLVVISFLGAFMIVKPNLMSSFMNFLFSTDSQESTENNVIPSEYSNNNK
jgi:drug/metabolite transporter (DMT)-like permease